MTTHLYEQVSESEAAAAALASALADLSARLRELLARGEADIPHCLRQNSSFGR